MPIITTNEFEQVGIKALLLRNIEVPSTHTSEYIASYAYHKSKQPNTPMGFTVKHMMDILFYW